MADIAFDDFTVPTLARLSLKDGDPPTQRPDISASRKWIDGDAQGSFRGKANLKPPFDGETGTSAAGVFLIGAEFNQIEIGRWWPHLSRFHANFSVSGATADTIQASNRERCH